MAQKKRQPARRKSSSRKTTRSGSAARKKRSSSDKRRRNATRRWLGRAGLLLVVSAAAIVVWLDYRIVSAFEGRRWDLPARVYARPLELAAGLPLSAAALEGHLKDLGYKAVSGEAPRPGSYFRRGESFRILTRAFPFWDGHQGALSAQVDLAAGAVRRLRAADGETLGTLRLDPKALGTVFPGAAEDRLILSPEEIPALLRAALVVTEDRRFDSHFGVDPRAILRAAGANLKAGKIEQGGSTLTQQLVKNYFLTSRQTLPRKLQEAVMAVLLELHYSKEEILTAYVNEVYLGQDGRRAVHGFGLGSQFYFGKSLTNLQTQEIALLAAVIRGPSWYNPWRHPERAKERRDRVLGYMASAGVITEQDAAAAASRPLGLRKAAAGTADYTPAFLALVRRQLARDYGADDLAQAGLMVFSTLDPMVQTAAEEALETGIRSAEARGLGSRLEGAVVVTHPHTGEVLAAVGGRRLRFDGFNRAIDARRPIGSLVKPLVYLTAMETGRYSLATPVEDVPVTVALDDGSTWSPRNFSGTPHGRVPVVRALAESMNLAAVNTGLDVGVDLVAHRLGELTGGDAPAPNPALLLGAVDFSPLDVAELYGVLASGGFRTPLRAVLEVSDASGNALERYPLNVRAAADPAAVDQVVQAMQQTFERGTAKSAAVPPGLRAAGKTGTTDGGRDSWFAGFTGDRLAVVWIGRDDNEQTRLTGSSGALPVWSEIMTRLPTTSLVGHTGAEQASVQIDYATGRLVRAGCADAISVRLPEDTELEVDPACDPGRQSIVERGKEWLKRLTR
jgi:penicillin-binding protein 1B